jgi:hypothetical protein
MKVTVQGKGQVSLTKNDFLASGGQGDIYVKGDQVYKIYQKASECLTYGKIQELSVLTDPYIIKPESLLFDGVNNTVGYTMRYVKDNISMCQLFPKVFKDQNNITREMIITLVERLREIVTHIHSKGILIVDLNENNFMIDKKTFSEVFAIDVDSYQTKSFPATAIMENIRDPHTKQFNQLSDWYSFGIIACNLFLGIHPFKGKHPGIKGFPERMMQNVSIFNKEVSVPKIVPELTTIPENYRNWFIAMFERGERCLPPNEMGLIIQISKVLQTIISNDMFDIKELMDYHTDLIRFYSFHGRKISYTKDNTIIYGKLRYKFPVNNVSLAMTPKSECIIGVYSENGKLKLINTYRQTEMPINLVCDGHMNYEGRVYVKVLDKIVELVFLETSNEIIPSSRVVCNVMEKSSELYDGCVIQNLLGSYFVSVFPKERTHYQFKIEEFEKYNYRVINAKYIKGILMIIVEKHGRYDKFIFKLNEKHTEYRIMVKKGITLLDINFTVLDNGIVVHIDDEENLEIFWNRLDKDDIKRFEDNLVSSEMKLFSDGVQTVFGKENKLYSLKIK